MHRLVFYGAWIQEKIVPKIKAVFMFSLFIRAQLFGYVYFILAGIKKPVFEKNLLQLGSSKQQLNSFCYYFMFAYVTTYPIIVGLFLLTSGP